jgi:hypothetical protein
MRIIQIVILLSILPLASVLKAQQPIGSDSYFVYKEALRLISPGNIQFLEEIIVRQENTAKQIEFEKLKKSINLVQLREKLFKKDHSALSDVNRFNLFARSCFSDLIDSPLLFVKRHTYHSDHIYDDYLTWHPGGGIYMLQNPLDLPSEHKIVSVVDAKSSETLGEGVYRDPEISYDGKKVLFSFKGEQHGGTSIFEIDINGNNLKQLTNPVKDMIGYIDAQGTKGKGHHDITPCYMPNGQIAFTSTRQRGHVLCVGSHVDILHTMNSDGSDIKRISVSPLNEFDPVIMHDGRIMYGRWEYVDKSALYIQSLWTVNPDGTNETAFYGNNMGKPTSILDPRPVPGTDLVACSLTPHNGAAVGAIAMIDSRLGKNNMAAIFNFTPEYPERMGQGLLYGPSDPFPLSKNTVIIANNDKKHGSYGVIELIDRTGFRMVLHREEGISCYAPIPVKSRIKENIIPSSIVEGEPGSFFVSDIYQGLEGVEKGDVKWLRVLETESRTTGSPPNGRWWNQANLISWQGSYDVKNFIGLVPVEEDGSALFEAPIGKALYFQALDKDKRMIQSQRTFVQALPGITRSCVGCHDENAARTVSNKHRAIALNKPPVKPIPETWGTGHIDYAKHIQPIFDKNCVECHGGKKGIAAAIDLSGGWTWAFNISYETLIKHVFTGFLNCENMQEQSLAILPPYTHGSGAAPLTNLIETEHDGRIDLSDGEKDIIKAWMDANSCYYGTWDYTLHAVNDSVFTTGKKLVKEMDSAGCLKCHKPYVGNDWVNFQKPEMSRILRAPMKKGEAYGLEWCRDRGAKYGLLPMVSQRNQPPDVFVRSTFHQPLLANQWRPNRTGKPLVLFNDKNDSHYIKMLEIIKDGKNKILQTPRVDMPGAKVVLQKCLIRTSMVQD